MSTVYDCGEPESRRRGIAAAVSAARGGRLVVFPTDTVYGLGCDAFDTNAVRSLLAAKGRGADMPASVLVGSWSTIDGLVRTVPESARALVRAFWPGGLSIVLAAAPSLAWDLGNTRGTVMVRMPLHPVAVEVLRQVGPMAQSSANRTGHAPATDAADARDQLGDAVAVYLDGGPSGDPVPSTIIDMTGAEPCALREGAITLTEVSDVLGFAVELAR